MAIKAAPIEPHWSYFLAIERDLEVLSRFIEFDTRNFDSFSLEIARILLAAGAEVDVVCKQICQSKDPKSQADNIDAYRRDVLKYFPKLPDFTVEIPRFGLTLHPWDEWNNARGVPSWWTAYNKIKHHRHTHYDRASLENCLNAVAALFVATLYLYEDQAGQGALIPSPQLCRPGQDHYGGSTYNDFEFGINYRL